MVPYPVIWVRDICGLGKPTAEKKSVAPKSFRLIPARCMALVPLFGPRVLQPFAQQSTLESALLVPLFQGQPLGDIQGDFAHSF